MYHYLFTNDLRISRLDEALAEAGLCFAMDTVPSAIEDKNANNNMNTLGFYFNLTQTSNCAIAASKGDIRKVVLNFIKKFQFPNPRTSDSMNAAISDNITLVPMRVIMQALYIMRMIDPAKAFLSKKEIADYIFFNDDIAKTENPDIASLATIILNSRQDEIEREIPDDDELQKNGRFWKQCKRQIREMVKILCWTGCVVEQEDGCISIVHNNLSRENKADLFEIITFTGLWKPHKDADFNANKLDYQRYMDIEIATDKSDKKEGDIKMTNDVIFETAYASLYMQNRILFGAPGTGKSFMLNEEAKKLLKDGGCEERVTFHPDYSYANFVGTYKPVMVGGCSGTTNSISKDVITILSDETKTAQEKYDLLYDKFKDDGLTRLPILLGLYTDETFKTRKQDGTDAVGDNSVERNHGKALRPYVTLPSEVNVKEEISYEYVPGPFMRVLVKALKNAMTGNPKPHLLIIEEINRANVAAVFGDVFQLLDRASNNVSEYEIATTNEMRTYLAKELGVEKSVVETIRIPDNMFIWATMNSADQGVYPMDTAFKRRWDFTYLGIDDIEKDLIGKTVILGTGSTKQKVEWNKLRKAINNFLAKEKINEDKQLGPYFIARSIVVPEKGTEIDNDRFIHTFKSKVIMYLFEDAAKQKRPKLFEGCFENSSRYSEICREFDKKGVGIFHHDIQIEADPADLAGATPVDNE